MLALDTNVLARLVTNDDPAQARRAAELIDSGEAFFVSLGVALELEWVLRGAYALDAASVVRCFESLLSLRNLHFEAQAKVSEALKQYADKFDFADALHLGAAAQCTALLTFDKRFAARAQKARTSLAVRLI